MQAPQNDLQVEFQRVVEETIAGNLRSVHKQVPTIDPDDLLRSALMGGTAAIVTYWFATAHKEGALGEARDALDATIEQFWGQMLMGVASEGGDSMSLAGPN